MPNGQNDKVIYKMYKKGRFWVFAGITLATINLGTLTGQAAVETTATTKPETKSAATEVSQLNQPTVTLKSGNKAANNENVTANSQPASQQSMSVATVDSHAGTESSVDQASQSSETQTTVAKITTDTETEVSEATPDSAVVTPTEQANSQSQSTEKVVSTKSAQPMRTTMARAVAAKEIASGTLNIDGGSSWTLDDDGLLTISAGNWSNITVDANSWYGFRQKIAKVVIEGPVVAGPRLSYAFSQQTNPTKKLTSIEGLANIKTDNVTTMSNLFAGSSITDFSGLKDWNTSNVTDMTAMFSSVKATNATDLPIAGWDVSHVTDFTRLFQNSALETLDLSSWAVGKNTIVTSLTGMFGLCANLKSVNVSGWDTSQIKQGQTIFNGDSSLTSLDLSSWDLRQMTSNANMLGGTTSLKALTLGANTRLTTAVNLPNVPTNSGTWQNEAATATTDPAYTSSELVGLYSGNTVPSATTTYIWSPASSAAIEAKDVTIFAGQTSSWSPKDSVTKIVDGNGNALDLTTVDVNSLVKVTSVNGDTNVTTIDTTIPGKTYTIVLTYTDVNGIEVQATSVVQVVANQAGIETTPITVIAGKKATWNLADGIKSITDVNGNPVDFADAKVTVNADGLDLSQPGTYTVQVTYTDNAGHEHTADLTINAIATKATVVAKDTTVVMGPQTGAWQASDNFVSATDADGKSLTLADVTVKGSVDTSKTGDYEVTYSYTDVAGNVKSQTITVHVIASQVSVDAKDSTIIAGPNSTWNAKDNFVSATDATGKSITLADVKVTGTVNPNKAGDYKITYTYTDTYGNEVTKTITVKVVASQLSVDAKDSTITAGPKSTWSAKDNFVSATDATGKSITLADVKVTGTVNPNKAGDYKITYTYTDTYGNEVTKTITVKVVASQLSVDAKDSTIIAGTNSTWNAKDNFVSATDAAGESITLADAKVTGTVNPNKAGNYKVTYTYTDVYGNEVTKSITVKVVASQLSVDAKDSTIIAGPKTTWNAKDNFIGATDAAGKPVTLADVKVTGTVNPNKAGDYKVTYTYTDAYGNEVTKTITVHVVASQLSLKAKDSTLTAGPKTTWNAQDNFVNATDAAGKPVKLADVKVTGSVDPTKAGTYQVTYSYTDAFGNEVTQTITVKVVVSQAALKVKDSQLKVGAKWQASDNLVSATDASGQALTVENLVVTGVVETARAGIYKVTYQYTDAAGNVVTATATITVTADAEQPGGGDHGNGGDSNGSDNGDGDLINEGNGGNPTAPGSNDNGNPIIKPDNSGNQTSVTGDQIISSQPNLKQPTTPIQSTRLLPQANEKRTASWLALAGVGLMALLATVGYRRKH